MDPSESRGQSLSEAPSDSPTPPELVSGGDTLHSDAGNPDVCDRQSDVHKEIQFVDNGEILADEDGNLMASSSAETFSKEKKTSLGFTEANLEREKTILEDLGDELLTPRLSERDPAEVISQDTGVTPMEIEDINIESSQTAETESDNSMDQVDKGDEHETAVTDPGIDPDSQPQDQTASTSSSDEDSIDPDPSSSEDEVSSDDFSDVGVEIKPENKKIFLDPDVVTYLNDMQCSQVMRMLKEQYQTQSYCDVQVFVGNSKYMLHKCVLAANSVHFNAMLKDPSVHDLNLGNMSLKVFESLVEYMYTGQLGVSMDSVEELLTVCKDLGIQDVQQCCSLHLSKNIDITTWMTVLLIAKKFDLVDVIKSAIQFLGENLSFVASSDDILKLETKLLLEVLSECNPETASETEASKLEVALKWVQFDFEYRKYDLPQVIELIDGALITKASLKTIKKNRMLRRRSVLEEDLVKCIFEFIKSHHEQLKMEAKLKRKMEKEEERSRLKEEKRLQAKKKKVPTATLR